MIDLLFSSTNMAVMTSCKNHPVNSGHFKMYIADAQYIGMSICSHTVAFKCVGDLHAMRVISS